MKISICIPARNHLDELKQTLPVNLADNADDPDHEFAILDYGSTDGVEGWICGSFTGEMDSGRILFHRSPGHTFLDRPHSRNVSIAVAQGSWVCHLAPREFLGRNFICGLRRLLAAVQPPVAFCRRPTYFGSEFLALPFNLFREYRGYDERLSVASTCDLRERLSRAGAVIYWLPPAARPPVGLAVPCSGWGTDEGVARANHRAGILKANQGAMWGNLIVRDHQGHMKEVGYG